MVTVFLLQYGDTALLVAFTDAYEYDEDDNEVEKVIDESLIKALIDGGSDLNCQEQVICNTTSDIIIIIKLHCML